MRWARVKQGDGWQGLLHLWDSAGRIEGGFLLLIKATRWGRIGFVNKGPVLAREGPESVRDALRRVLDVARTERLRALVLQPPDRSSIRWEDLRHFGFCRAPVPGIIDATLIASLDGGREGILARLSRTARKQVRSALRHGVGIVEGTRSDLPRFFELMCHTCRRQGVTPNPANVEGIYRRWDAFQSQVKVLFARIGEELVAGRLLICFGVTCTSEKKGWNERFPEAHPNTLLSVEAMVRAAEWGCRYMDFAAMDRRLAERMLRGEDVEKEISSTRYNFNLRLGARPFLLPCAHVWMPRAWQRPWVDWVLSRRWLARQLERIMSR